MKPSEHKTVDKPVNFHALYTPGNHCYDGGDTMLYDALKSVNGVSFNMIRIIGGIFCMEIEKYGVLLMVDDYYIAETEVM